MTPEHRSRLLATEVLLNMRPARIVTDGTRCRVESLDGELAGTWSWTEADGIVSRGGLFRVAT